MAIDAPHNPSARSPPTTHSLPPNPPNGPLTDGPQAGQTDGGCTEAGQNYPGLAVQEPSLDNKVSNVYYPY